MVWLYKEDDKIIYTSKVGQIRKKRKPKRRWRDEVKDSLKVRGLNMQEGVRCTRDRMNRSNVVY